MFKFFKNIMNSISSQASWSPNYFDNYYLIHCNISMINFKKNRKLMEGKTCSDLQLIKKTAILREKNIIVFL